MATFLRALPLRPISLGLLRGVCAFALTLVPVPALSQPASDGPTELFSPKLMVSAGLGSVFGRDSSLPLQTLSLQFLHRRHLALEADVSHWRDSWNVRRPGTAYTFNRQVVGYSGEYFEQGTSATWSAGVNVMFRTEPRRATAYVGGGPIFARAREQSVSGVEGCTVLQGFGFRCQNAFVIDSRRNEFGGRGMAGIDVLIVRGVRGYGDVQFFAWSDPHVRFMAGARFDVLSQSAGRSARARADRLAEFGAGLAAYAQEGVGRKVRVTFKGGKRLEARLLELSDAALVFERNGREERHLLEDILIVETAHYAARIGAVIGAVAGAIWFYSSCPSDCEPVRWTLLPLGGALGGGLGAAIGAMADRTRREFHVLYLAPIAGTGKAGGMLSFVW